MQKVLKSYRTKRKLAEALKELLNMKSLEKIRIRELTERCDIHRQTFYYHFDDIYALFAWCVQQDAETLAAQLARLPSWQESLCALLEYIAKNRGCFIAILEHMPAAERKPIWDRLLAPVLEKLPHTCPDSQENEIGICQQNLSIMLFALLEKWIQGESGQSAAEAIRFLENLSNTRVLA